MSSDISSSAFVIKETALSDGLGFVQKDESEIWEIGKEGPSFRESVETGGVLANAFLLRQKKNADLGNAF